MIEIESMQGGNPDNFKTIDEAKAYIVDTILRKINSYDIVEKKINDQVRWILNVYKGEVLILDDKPSLMEYKIPHVAEFIFERNSTNGLWYVKKDPSTMDEIISNFTSKYRSLISYLEQIILEVSWKELLDIAQIENSVTPFYDIIRRIARIGAISTKDIKELEKKRNKSFKKYIDLLISSKIIEKAKGGFVFTNESLKILKASKSPKKAPHDIMAFFISKSATQLIHNMHLYPLKSYVFLENAYYIPTLQLSTMKKITLDTYEKLYQRVNRRTLMKGYIYSLYKLDEVGLIEVSKDKYIFGVEEKFDSMNNEYNTAIEYIM